MLLPVPTLPPFERGPSADAVAEVVGEDLVLPLREAEAARRRAEESLSELAACRPTGLSGAGRLWREAEEADVSDAAVGLCPDDGWRTAGLLSGDADRWADASVAVKALSRVRVEVARRLDRDAIASAASSVVVSATQAWAEEAAAGWGSRDDKATAWAHVRAGEVALAEFYAARQVGLWVLGTPERRDELEAPPSTQWLPEHKVGLGHWLALMLVVDPQRWLRMPPDVTWPSGSMRLVEIALEGTKGLVELRERGVFAAAK